MKEFDKQTPRFASSPNVFTIKVVVWAAITYYLLSAVLGHAFAELVGGNIEGFWDQLIGFFGVYLLILILHLPFILFFWLIVLIYRYANSKPLFGTRKETAVVEKSFGKRFQFECMFVGVAVGSIAYWANGGA